MLPPLSLSGIDHRIDPSPLPFEERRVLRRSAPERLRLALPSAGWPPLLLRAEPPPEPLRAPLREGGGWARRLAGALRRLAPA